jgi:hypothetical protein
MSSPDDESVRRASARGTLLTEVKKLSLNTRQPPDVVVLPSVNRVQSASVSARHRQARKGTGHGCKKETGAVAVNQKILAHSWLYGSCVHQIEMSLFLPFKNVTVGLGRAATGAGSGESRI